MKFQMSQGLVGDTPTHTPPIRVFFLNFLNFLLLILERGEGKKNGEEHP